MATVKVSQKWYGKEAIKAAEVCAGKSAFEIGLAVESQAKLLINPVTGRLRGSITTASKDTQSNIESPATSEDKITPPKDVGEVYVGSAVEYAAYVEYGTGKYVAGGRQTPWSYQDAQGFWHTTQGMPAKPFLRPALELVKGNAIPIVQKNGKAEFDEALNDR